MAKPPRIIATGTSDLIEQPPEVDFDPTRGTVYHRRYKAIGNVRAAIAFNNFAASRIAAQVKLSPAVSELQATVSGGQNGFSDQAQTSWEIQGNETQRSILELASSAQIAAEVKDANDALSSGELDLNSFGGDITAAITDFLGSGSADIDEVVTLLGFIMRGQTHFPEGQYVARMTTSISNFYTGDIFIGSAESIWSTGSLLGLGQPPAISQMISAVGSGSAHDGYVFGWRQLPPRAHTGAYNRIEVAIEWWFAEWSVFIYGDLI